MSSRVTVASPPGNTKVCMDQQMKWKEWVETMEAIHHPVWKAAGIYGAVKSEATITLEDMNSMD
ncbi:hypothetical protein KY284_001437 [Solanum tuberosum]|nr:hypothetical protein KY284_001437 [Solanum tuberosum]